LRLPTWRRPVSLPAPGGRPIVGGGRKTAELTLKGFKDDVCSTAHTFLLDNPMMKNDELKLRDYGLEYIDPIRSSISPFRMAAI